MERFLVFIALLFSWTCLAATPGNAPILTIAAPGQNTQALSIPLSSLSGTGVNGVFSLYGGSASTGLTNANFYPFYKNGVQYQVTAGKTAYCFNFKYTGGNANVPLQLVSSTATFAYNAASLTSPVYQGGATQISPLQGGAANTTVPMPGVYTFAASTFPGFQNNSASVSYGVTMECYEQ